MNGFDVLFAIFSIGFFLHGLMLLLVPDRLQPAWRPKRHVERLFFKLFPPEIGRTILGSLCVALAVLFAVLAQRAH